MSNHDNLGCNPLTDNLHKRACRSVKGGVHGTIYGFNLGQIDSYTVTDKLLTSLVMKVNTMTTDPYYGYQIKHKEETAGVENVFVKGTNTEYWNQTLDFAVQGLEVENKLAFESLGNGKSVFFAKDGNKQWHVVGIESGCEMQDGARIGTGIETDSLVGSQGQFLAKESFVTPTVASGVSIQVLGADGVTVETITFP